MHYERWLGVGMYLRWFNIGLTLTAWCGKGFFLPGSTFSTDSLALWQLQCLSSPCVQSHALTSVHTLKIPNIGSYIMVQTHRNTAQSVTLCQPLKTECGGPSGTGIENGHRVHYLDKKRNVEDSLVKALHPTSTSSELCKKLTLLPTM